MTDLDRELTELTILRRKAEEAHEAAARTAGRLVTALIRRRWPDAEALNVEPSLRHNDGPHAIIPLQVFGSGRILAGRDDLANLGEGFDLATILDTFDEANRNVWGPALHSEGWHRGDPHLDLRTLENL